jgi:hypothetical protein
MTIRHFETHPDEINWGTPRKIAPDLTVVWIFGEHWTEAGCHAADGFL